LEDLVLARVLLSIVGELGTPRLYKPCKAKVYLGCLDTQIHTLPAKIKLKIIKTYNGFEGVKSCVIEEACLRA
jgi:hypothetical protein